LLPSSADRDDDFFTPIGVAIRIGPAPATSRARAFVLVRRAKRHPRRRRRKIIFACEMDQSNMLRAFVVVDARRCEIRILRIEAARLLAFAVHAMRMRCARIAINACDAAGDDRRPMNGDKKKLRKHVDTSPRRD
jgi:hypothetical protein